MYLDIEVYKGDDNIFVAACPQFNLFSNGGTREEAIDNLKAIIEKYIKHSNIFGDIKRDLDYSIRFYSSRRPQVH